MNNITDKFIDHLFDLSKSKISSSAILQAKNCLLDYFGVTFAGAMLLKEKGDLYLDFLDSNSGNAKVIGFEQKTDLYTAALLNGINSHVVDMDDGVRQGNFHPGSPVISALFPLAQLKKLEGIDLLRGIIVGYEASIRLAKAIQPSHRNRGYHATGTCGVIGVAMGVATMLKYSKYEMKNALSAASTSSSGLLNVIKGSSELKPFNSGQASVAGLAAALVARAGFKGSADVLNGQWGYIGMVTDNFDSEKLLKEEKELEIANVYFKPFAACRHTHSAIEAVLQLKRKFQIDPRKVEKIIVRTYRLAKDGHDHTEIEGVTSAKLSIPFSIALALQLGKVGINEFKDEIINNQEILTLTKKVRVVEDENLNVLVPLKRPSIVEIFTNENNLYTERIDLAMGEPENPLSKNEFNEKFYSLLEFSGKGEVEIKEISSHIWNIETEFENLIKKL